MARIDIEIEDYLDEVDTENLLKELGKRDVNTVLKDVDTDDLMNEVKDRFISPDETLNLLRHILGLRPWHDKERIIQEIEQL